MKKWFVRIKDFIMASGDMHISAFAGQSVFFIFMSFFPLLNILLALIPLFSISEIEMTQMITKVFPEDLGKYLGGIIKDIYSNGTPSLTIISLLVGLWASAKGVMAIRNGLNEVYRAREKRNFLLVRAVSMLYTLIFIAVLVVLTLANLFGRQLYQSFMSKHNELEDILGLVVHLRGVGSFIVIFVLLWGMYTIMPNRKLFFRYQAFGALFASGSWVLVSWLFSYYLEFAMKKSYMYGSLSAIIMILVWMYTIVNIIFIGAMINEFLFEYVYRERVERRLNKRNKMKAMKRYAHTEHREERRELRAQRKAKSSEESDDFGLEDPEETEAEAEVETEVESETEVQTKSETID